MDDNINNKLFGNGTSLSIILRQYKKDNISEDETIQLIEDLYRNRINYVPSFPTWPQITYEQPEIQKYEVTCNCKR